MSRADGNKRRNSIYRMLEGQELSGERMDRRTRGRQYRIDLGEWTQLPTKGPDLLSGRGTDWGFLMPTMVAATLYEGSGSATRAEIEAGADCKVSCGFTHPIIRASTMTLRTLLKKSWVWIFVVQDDQIARQQLIINNIYNWHGLQLATFQAILW